jgi:phospholipid/cholesterol/gamma-HCH transport system permease protein
MTIIDSAKPPSTPSPDAKPSAKPAREKPLGETVHTVGEMVRFSGSILKDLPQVRKFSTEVLHQAGILILSSGIIIWFMQFVIGSMCATEASYTLKQVGAPIYSGVFADYCGLREMSPYMWAYIWAAKVGCGLVAEIGSMRIADEVDAMEVMGIKSRVYLVGTRILACWLAMPFLFIVGLGFSYVAMYLVVVSELADVSSGGYLYTFWLFQNPYDLFAAVFRVMVYGTIVTFVGCYFGYTASGGPVGVGKATAKSMMWNMVLIHLAGILTVQFFWGLHPNAPISN